MITNLSKRILLSITGEKRVDWKNKLKEVKKLKLKKVALFLECYSSKERKLIYAALLNSGIKQIPFVHARYDMKKWEYVFLIKRFKTKYFNLHSDLFKKLKNLNGIHKKILLELSYENHLHRNMDLNKIGGFCIDLSHFKASEERWTNEFEFVLKKEQFKKYFIANHISGYSYPRKKDLHTIRTLSDFEYLKTLPEFLFGKYIALEVDNSIKDQIKFKKNIINILKSHD